MASEKELVFARLRRQRSAEAVVDSIAVANDWIEAVDQLMNRLYEWIEEAEHEGLFEVEDLVIDLDEPKLGSYQVRGLCVKTPRSEVIKIVPKARYSVGTLGRVDLECPPRKTILVRSEPDRWQFAILSPASTGWVFHDLTEETFWKNLGDLLS